MESPQTKMRLVLILGKFQVTKVDPGLTGVKFTLKLGGSVTLTADCPVPCDVQLGDRLTLYTEVLADAIPSAAPVQ